MSFAEKAVKEHATKDPPSYTRRVRWVALIYFVLNILSIAIIVTIAWRVQFFVTLSQRSNVETLTLVIIFILAVYYLLTTFKGLIGALPTCDPTRAAKQAVPTGISAAHSGASLTTLPTPDYNSANLAGRNV